jgi:hypothetical protein
MMFGAQLLGLNATGLLKESQRSQREYLADSDRAATQACLVELREAQARSQACC